MDRRSSLSREEKVERGREDDRRTLKRGSTRLARRDEGIGDRGCVCAPNNTREDEGWGKKLGMGLAIYIGRARKGKGRSGGKGIPRAVLCCRCRDGFVPCERSEEAERTWKPPPVEVERNSREGATEMRMPLPRQGANVSRP